MNIGDNIKKFRELKNLTREQVASQLEMSVSNYSKIERGEIDLTISRIEKIAEILNVGVSQVLNFDASQIFNISNNNFVQGLGAKAENINFTNDDYKNKYIEIIELELKKYKDRYGEII